MLDYPLAKDLKLKQRKNVLTCMNTISLPPEKTKYHIYVLGGEEVEAADIHDYCIDEVEVLEVTLEPKLQIQKPTKLKFGKVSWKKLTNYTMRVLPYQAPKPTSISHYGFKVLYTISTEFDAINGISGLNFVKREQMLMQREGKQPQELIKHFIVREPVLPQPLTA